MLIHFPPCHKVPPSMRYDWHTLTYSVISMMAEYLHVTLVVCRWCVCFVILTYILSCDGKAIKPCPLINLNFSCSRARASRARVRVHIISGLLQELHRTPPSSTAAKCDGRIEGPGERASSPFPRGKDTAPRIFEKIILDDLCLCAPGRWSDSEPMRISIYIKRRYVQARAPLDSVYVSSRRYVGKSPVTSSVKMACCFKMSCFFVTHCVTFKF